MGAATVRGRLPVEVVQRVVRMHFGPFRLCYDKGLAKDPRLGGRLVTSFVIDPQGAASGVADAGSDLPDADVAACVRRGFASLTFPPPESGAVTVVYPITFEPADAPPPPPP
ncbi:MAG TPA: AgmX/PglI C-terminal domain-containing protein [Minicystis sp.]|nr:AgmX/PglI C-terminal domain-containing protein [Minicystis sp.]